MTHETMPAQGPVDVNVSPLPWGDCKVAFGID